MIQKLTLLNIMSFCFQSQVKEMKGELLAEKNLNEYLNSYA